jgi:hypothetical protein
MATVPNPSGLFNPGDKVIKCRQGTVLWFLNFFAEKNCEKIGVFDSKQS